MVRHYIYTTIEELKDTIKEHKDHLPLILIRLVVRLIHYDVLNNMAYFTTIKPFDNESLNEPFLIKVDISLVKQWDFHIDGIYNIFGEVMYQSYELMGELPLVNKFNKLDCIEAVLIARLLKPLIGLDWMEFERVMKIKQNLVKQCILKIE